MLLLCQWEDAAETVAKVEVNKDDVVARQLKLKVEVKKDGSAGPVAVGKAAPAPRPLPTPPPKPAHLPPPSPSPPQSNLDSSATTARRNSECIGPFSG